MLTDQSIIAYVATTDPERSRVFYASTLGLRLVDETPYALVFDANGTMLRVTRVAAATPPAYTVLGWKVRDLVGEVTDLVGRGVRFERFAGLTQDERGIWTTDDGDRIAWFKDPDGNLLSLSEIAS